MRRLSCLIALLACLVLALPAFSASQKADAIAALQAAGPPFRSIDGAGNNVAHPAWGRAGGRVDSNPTSTGTRPP